VINGSIERKIKNAQAQAQRVIKAKGLEKKVEQLTALVAEVTDLVAAIHAARAA